MEMRMFAEQTAEDKAINRDVAARMGTWDWVDHRSTARAAATRELSWALTGARVGFALSSMVRDTEKYVHG